MVKKNVLRRFLVLACFAGAMAGIAGVAIASPAAAKPTFEVARVIDGDTIALTNGERVRLLQIDTPELGSAECYSRAARTALLRLVPEGSSVVLEADPALDNVDRYGRLLRYVKRAGINVNIRLVLNGAAAPYFYRGERGKYATRLIAAVSRARSAKKGLWRACPATTLSLIGPLQTRQGRPKPPVHHPPQHPEAGNCHPSYKGACLDPNAYDYDCEGGSGNGPLYTGFVRVVGSDDFGLDGDGDGLGCE